jgi:hypothetical protein
MTEPTDPAATRRDALREDIRLAGDLVAQCIAEALALGIAVPIAVHEAVAALDLWARRLRSAR